MTESQQEESAPVVWAATTPRRTHPVTPVVKALRIAPGLLIFFFIFGGEGVTQVVGRIGALGVVALLMLATAGASWLSWTRLTYWFDDDGDLRIQSGILQHNERRIQVSRLQSVDVSQPLLARIFGLAQIRPEVAGSSGRGNNLEYLEVGHSQQFRAELLARAAGLEVSHNEAAPVAPERVLVSVPTGTLLASVVLQPATLVALVLFPALLVGGAVTRQFGVFVPAFFVLVAPLVMAVSQFLQWFNFTVAESPDGLRLRFGLTSHRSQTVPPGRVQALRLESPLLWKRWDWARVMVNVAGPAGEDGSERPSIVLPVAPIPVARAVLAQVLPGIDPFDVELAPVPARARWCSILQYRRLAIGASDEVFVARHGWLVPKWDVIPHARTQSVRLTQGPWQRRHRLASVHVDSTPGPVRIAGKHRDEMEARRIVEEQALRAMTARAVAAPDKWLRARPLAAETVESVDSVDSVESGESH